RGEVAAHQRAGRLETVLDGAPHERLERLGWRAGSRYEARRDVVQGDQVARSDRGAGVVERAVGVGELERLQPEHAGQLEPELERLVGLGRDRGPGAVELLGSTRASERLQWVE